MDYCSRRFRFLVTKRSYDVFVSTSDRICFFICSATFSISGYIAPSCRSHTFNSFSIFSFSFCHSTDSNKCPRLFNNPGIKYWRFYLSPSLFLRYQIAIPEYGFRYPDSSGSSYSFNIFLRNVFVH